MAHGFVTTGLSHPDSTIQTTAGAITPTGAFALTKGSVPSGWLQCDASYSKTTYPALYAVIGEETNASMLPAFNTFESAGYFDSNNLGVSTGDRRVDRFATSGDGRFMVLADAGKIYYSNSGAVSWTSLGAPTGTGDLYSICYAGGSTWIVTGVTKIWFTTNNGTNWTAGTGFVGAQNFWASAYNSQNNTLLVSSSSGYFQRSTDGGATWTDLGLNLADRVYKLAWGDGYFVMGSNGSNISYSTNNGSSWTDLGALVGSDNVNKMRYLNGRFFGVGDNGNIFYTAKNSPPLAGNWTGTDLPIRGGTFDTTTELTDVSFLSSINCWFIGTNTSTYYWAYDYGQSSLEFYLGSGAFPVNGQQGYGDSVFGSGRLVTNHYVADGLVDAYGSPTYAYGIVSYVVSPTTPPNTHFWVSGNYINDGAYVVTGSTSSAPINIVKT
jgi:photosystem II stability/assembly factor-like uncharacterized protein